MKKASNWSPNVTTPRPVCLPLIKLVHNIINYAILFMMTHFCKTPRFKPEKIDETCVLIKRPLICAHIHIYHQLSFGSDLITSCIFIFADATMMQNNSLVTGITSLPQRLFKVSNKYITHTVLFQMTNRRS